MISQGGQPADGLSQSELIDRLLAGDQGAWRLVAEAVRPQLRDTAAVALPVEIRGRADASDIVQQTLIEANRAIQRFHGRSMSELVAWLTAILNNNVHDAVRRNVLAERRSVKKETCIEESSSGGPGWNGVCAADQTSPSMAVSRDEDRSQLQEALDGLPPRQRDAVRLRHLEGRTLVEIAAALDCTAQAAAALIARGLRALGESLNDADV